MRDCNYRTPLYVASASGHLDIVRMLVKEFGAHVMFQIVMAMRPCTAQHGNTEMVRALVTKFGADVNATTYNLCHTPLFRACEYGHINAVRVLVTECSADMSVEDIKGNTPLHVAALKGHTDIVRMILDLGASVNAKNNDGCTPLHVTSWNKEIETIRVLVDLGAEVNAKN